MSEQAHERRGETAHDERHDHAGEDVAQAAGGHGAVGAAGDAALARMAGATQQVALPAAVRAKLEQSFGALPPFEVVVDPAHVPPNARAASDGKHVYLRDAKDLHDVALVAHEVAHVLQFHGGPKRAATGAEAEHAIPKDGAIAAAAAAEGSAREGGDETGAERRSLEEVADKAAADVLAGRKIAELATTPVTEGETYLDAQPGKLPAKAVRIVLFPGESTDGATTRGHLYVYVNGKLVKAYDACGGPPPGQGHADRGGHSAGETPAGDYVLGAAQHHTTPGWPMSVVPWGARLRERSDKDIEYSSDGKTWLKATGPGGTMTNAAIAFEERTRASQAAAESARTGKPVKPTPLTDAEKQQIGVEYRSVFYGDDGALLPEYNKNDFGKWAFDLETKDKKGALHGSPYFVHTTPDDEQTTAAGGQVDLHNSHGCVHIRPADREEMMALGYLQAGVKFTVKPYGAKGP